jgi:hypothetical protein
MTVTRSWQPLTFLVAALLALAGVCERAAAGTASSDGGAVRFADPAGAADDLAVTADSIALENDADGLGGWRVSFLQFDPVTAPGPGCRTGFVSTVCPFGANPPAEVIVDLGAGDDRLQLVSNTVAPSTRFSVFGGPGTDLIETYQTRAAIDGGAGDDVLRPDDRPSVLASPPEPTPGGIIKGGPGVDAVNYDNALDPISVSLDGKANDGRPGERDNVMRDVENVVSSQFAATLIGSDARNDISGGNEGDRIVGRAGKDTLSAGSGADTVDTIDGAGGDRADCGDGADIAYADGGDLLAMGGCEKIVWAPILGSAALRVNDGQIPVSLKCPTGGGRCRGTLRLRSTAKGRPTLATARYSVKGGRRSTIRLKPTHAGNAALVRAKKIKATAILQPRGIAVDSGRTVVVRR